MTVYRLGDKLVAARSNEFGYANYEVEGVSRERQVADGQSATMGSDELASGKPAPSLLRRWLREPLLHVLLIGAALFAVYYALNPGAGQRQDSNRIVITADDLAQIRIAWMAQWQRPPTPDEMRNLLDGKIREEVLSREATALGLDKDDTIIKRRLAQKMEFVMDDVAALREPTDDELQALVRAEPATFCHCRAW